MGILFIVSTPIGNLEDITIRAIKTLFSVDGIACEDTRRTGLLLKSLQNIYDTSIYPTRKHGGPRLLSYYEQNERQRIPEIINALKNGLNIALISDAGTPLISDPGFKLIREALREGIRVVSIPGPSSVLSALVSSGLPTDKFLFLGYPPHKPGHRKQFFLNVLQSFERSKNIHPTVILFEAPHKLVRTLDEMMGVFGDIEIVLARELTKVHEEIWRGTLSEAKAKYAQTEPKGEFVVLFHLDLPSAKLSETLR